MKYITKQEEFPFEVQSGISPIDQSFKVFHAENPKVYRYFKRFAFEAIMAGAHHVKPGMVLGRVAWEITYVEKDFKAPPIDNRYGRNYCRIFSEEFPQYADVFPGNNKHKMPEMRGAA